jgi:hypothetical protein
VSLGTILGLIISSLVLVGTVGLGLLRFKHERKLADQEDARKVLADAARELWGMKQTMRDQFTVLGESLSSGTWPSDFQTRIGQLETQRDAVEAELDVLRIRFAKEQPIVVAYAAAWKAVKGLIGMYMAGYGGRGSREAYAEAFKQSEVFDDRRDDYLAAAEQAAGLDLDGTRQ